MVSDEQFLLPVAYFGRWTQLLVWAHLQLAQVLKHVDVVAGTEG
eukprot:CAMPEP_0170511938 /NCGR_PEP_ID=MMETSP0208-20121228/66574_1 /TAXON_ID=197538 /ORGANISM="Strombidium inclinatum, Strain S3" /LENGTH=43 /DNA_ID= /DNA_START= /DNA_END= /DNA_ORIENTATION=